MTSRTYTIEISEEGERPVTRTISVVNPSGITLRPVSTDVTGTESLLSLVEPVIAQLLRDYTGSP